MKDKRVMNLRSFTAFMVTTAFAVMVVTGVVLFIVPQGRIANWVDWRLLGLGKEAWGDLHLLFGMVFIVAGVAHLYPYNWKAFKNHLAKRVEGRLDLMRPKREAVLAVAATVLLAVGAIADVPPFSYLYHLNDTAKRAWVLSPDYEPPFGHAEELPLASIARKTGMDLDIALAELKARGLRVDGPSDRLNRVARVNGLSPMDVYMLIRQFEKRPDPKSLVPFTPEAVEERFEGTGVGRKTLENICNEVGVDMAVARKRLAAAGIEATGNETMRAVADHHDMAPIDVLKTLLIDGFKA